MAITEEFQLTRKELKRGKVVKPLIYLTVVLFYLQILAFGAFALHTFWGQSALRLIFVAGLICVALVIWTRLAAKIVKSGEAKTN